MGDNKVINKSYYSISRKTAVIVDVIVDIKHVTESLRDCKIIYNSKQCFYSFPFLFLALNFYL